MKRVLIKKPGSHDVLKLVTEPDPRPAAGQILVRVQAAGVNFADCIVRLGYYQAARGLYPMTPGFEFAGTVEARGEGVSEPELGASVFGITRFGGYSSHVVVEPWQVWPCPEGWDAAECAAFPAVAFTAHYGLFHAARVSAGESLLVHSAAGGVGTALLQLAAVAGCRSLAVVGSAHKIRLCRELGAWDVIDRSSVELWGEADRLVPEGFDVIFDSGGVETLREGYRRLAQGGRLVTYGFAEMFPRGKDVGLPGLALNYLRMPRFNPLELTAANRGVIGFNVVHLFGKRDMASKAMAELLGWIREKRVRKTPVARYPVDAVIEAHRALESGQTVGKLVLMM